MNHVIVALEGGLGNQMFQYAAGRSASIRAGLPLALDLRPLLARGQRNYALGDFLLGKNVELIAEGVPPGSGRLSRLLRLITGGGRTFREAGFPYDARIRSITTPVRLEGYFQSERYFSDITDTLRADFAPGKEAMDEIGRLANRLLPAGPCVSLHVRRGDYANPETSAVHGLLGADYYARALQILAERTGRRLPVCVFTDDPAWARAHLPLPEEARFVSEHTRAPLQDLILMSRCSHHITANSSFSWWGAWLNPHPEKVVVTPERWFQPAAGLDTRDLRPAGWLQT